MPSPGIPASSSGATALLVTAAAAFGLGISIGLAGNRRLNTSCENNQDQISAAESSTTTTSTSQPPKHCECGFDLTTVAPLQITRHRQSALHKANLQRTRGAPLLLTGKINEYRRAITTHVTADDVVLEVGCAEGLTTQRLAQCAKISIGIDLYERLITKARRRVGEPPEEGAKEDDDDDKNDADYTKVNAPEGRGWSNLHFYTADAMDKKAVLSAVNRALGVDEAKIEERKQEQKARVEAMIEEERKVASNTADAGSDADTKDLTRKQKRSLRRAALEKQGNGATGVAGAIDSSSGGSIGRPHSGIVTKIWLDVSGSRETRTVVQLIESLDAMFQPDLIVVKSDKLKNMSRRMYLPSSDIPGITHEPVNPPKYVIN